MSTASESNWVDEIPLDNRKHQFHIRGEGRDTFEMLGRPCELSAFSFVPPSRRHETLERTIYNFKPNSNTGEIGSSNYDSLFSVRCDFDNKVHRCDRQHAKLHGLDVWSEEITKKIPTRSSSEYGKHIVKFVPNESVDANCLDRGIKVEYLNQLDPPQRKHTRIAIVQSDFFNRNGINDLNKQRSVI